MRGTADHLAKDQPVWVERRIPFERILGLVPKLDPLEVLAETRDENVEEIGVLFWIPGRRTAVRRDAERWRGVVKAGQHIGSSGQPRQEPFIPGLSTNVMPVSPGNAGAEFARPDCL